jgi:hypothetical protein
MEFKDPTEQRRQDKEQEMIFRLKIKQDYIESTEVTTLPPSFN